MTLLLSSLWLRRLQVLESHKLKVAVIGAGNMGKNHLRNYSLLPDVELVALADPNPDTKSLAKEYTIDHFTDFKEMLDIVQPDLVSIVVPTPFHFAVASEVLTRGIHCLLEKPIASTVDEADKLIALAKKKNVVFTVGHIEHYNPLVKKIKTMIDANRIGKVTSVVCKRVGGFPGVEPKTDVIIDLAVHDIGIVSMLLGKQPNHITSHGSRTHHSKKIDSAEILMDYGYASGFIQANWLTPVKIRTISVTGSEGYIEGNYVTQELEFYNHKFEKKGEGFSGFVTTMKTQHSELIKVDFEEPLAEELKAFIAHIKGDKSVHLVDPHEARSALDLALKAVEPYNEV
jgi:UDP-N-acetylglucosamine 3-dehydrogenase